MKNKLIVTLTTVRGSRQYSLGQVARYIVALTIVLFATSFFISNWFLVKTSDDLSDLEEDHEQLSDQYEMMLGTQNLYKNELDQLSVSLSRVASQRDKLQAENIRMGDKLYEGNNRLGELHATLGASLNGLETLLNVEPSNDMSKERLESLTMMANQRLFMLNSIPNGVPIQAIRISDGFGMRMHPIRKKRVMHHGIDYKANIGTPVYSTADGVVESAGNKHDGYGKQVVILHGFGFKSSYSHLNKIEVSSGEFVHKGQKIAESGNTGKSTGPHLHYEVRHLYSKINPAPFVAWNIANFDTIFSTVKSVKWASLKNLYPLNQTVQP
ncbi:M23 family metallopeptidase [Neptunomonas japonica]|uniref:M23 family metallopeptidase n=1 Tax=Neptunomonas japonica TaxID=417574 RepID=UPI000403E92A|nr:M23 family metallopeptidase [Neptunomonas japonica]